MEKRHFDVIKKAKKLNKEIQEIRESYAYVRVVSLLSGLGFLITPDIKPAATLKVDLEAAIEMGLKVEPRIIEVLPAAILSFPKSFLHHERIPSELKEVITALKKREEGPSFANIKFDKFLEAARRPIKNKKRKLIEDKRISKTFRLNPHAMQALKEKAEFANVSCTSYLESLIVKA
jgi:hypothetical protein